MTILRRALHGDWSKLRTARTTVGLSVAVLILIPVLAVVTFVAATVGAAIAYGVGAAPAGRVVKLAQSSDAVGGPGGWPSLGLLCAYSAAALAGAAWVLRRRDA